MVIGSAVASLLSHAVPALGTALGALHQSLHLHGSPVDMAGVALAAAVSWIGVPGPGEPVLIAAGVYAARGKLDLAELLVVAWAAATAGGVAGWLLGRQGGRALWTARGPLLRWRCRTLARGERFFERHSLLAIYLAPSWVAGIHGVRASRYLPANAVFAVLWTLLVGLGAYLVGPPIEDVVNDVGLVTSVGLVALVAAFVLAERRRRRRRVTRPL